MNTPLRIEQILAIAEDYSNEFGLEAKHTVAFARGIETAVNHAQRGVPGWVLVPVEPTGEMLDATYVGQHCSDIWRDMLAAAPTAPQAAAQAEPQGGPDDIRAQGWTVAVHNDYRLDGKAHTFWLFTKNGRAVKGEGITDKEALDRVRAQLVLTEQSTVQAVPDERKAFEEWLKRREGPQGDEPGYPGPQSFHMDERYAAFEGWAARACVATPPVPPTQQASEQHPDDTAVDAFAAAMKAKLARAREKGRGGWQEADAGVLSGMLRHHVEKGDPRDVANFCMFLWSLGHGIAPAPQQASEQGQQPTDTQARSLALKANGDDMMVNGELKYCFRLGELKTLIQLAQKGTP